MLQGRLADLIGRHGAPGIAGALKSADLQINAAAGLSSSRGAEPITVRDRLPISCVMKVLIALVVLHGDDTGVLDIDLDISAYLPQLKGEAGGETGITLRHLLTHTAGYIEPQENSARWGYTWDRFVTFFPNRKQAFAPGAVWSYTHTGYVLLQKAVEVAFKRPIDDLLHEFILEPLGLRAELFEAGGPKAPNRVGLHVRFPRTGLYEPMRPPAETGFLRYSISDLSLSTEQLATLAGFLGGALKGRLPGLEPARTRLLQRAVLLPAYILGKEGETMPYAYCHGVADYGGFKGMNGSYVGSTCAIRFDETTSMGLAVAVNAWAPYLRDVAATDIARFVPKPAHVKPALAAPTFDDLSCLEGEYEGLMLGSANTTLVREDDVLLCTVHRKGAPDLQGRLALGADGQVGLVAGSSEITIAVAMSPERDEPFLMVNTSACRKLAS